MGNAKKLCGQEQYHEIRQYEYGGDTQREG